MVGKTLTWVLLNEAIEVVKETVVPDDGTSSAAYRRSLAVGFVFKFLLPLVESAAPASNHLNGSSKSCEETQHKAILLSSMQSIEVDKEYYPVGEPISKSLSDIQASGTSSAPTFSQCKGKIYNKL